jgi:subtilisin family serine protease
MSGTSMATPFGSGLLACIVEVMRRQGKPQWTAAKSVNDFFKANLKDSGAPGFDPRFGHGIPVADSLLQSLLRLELLIA